MRKPRALILPALFLFLSSFTYAADVWLQGQATHLQASRATYQFEAGVNGNISGDIGYFGFAQAYTDGYKQAYGGLTLKPFLWLEVGAGLGKESVGNNNRRAAYFSVTNSPFSASGVFENGASGPFHKVIAIYSVTEKVGLGFMSQKSLGVGPRIEYMPVKNWTWWVSGLRDRDRETNNKNFALGLMRNF